MRIDAEKDPATAPDALRARLLINQVSCLHMFFKLRISSHNLKKLLFPLLKPYNSPVLEMILLIRVFLSFIGHKIETNIVL